MDAPSTNEAAELADAIHEYEDLLDQLFDRGGQLAGKLVRARRAKGISGAVVAEIHRAYTEAQTGVAAAHSAAARGHKLLSAIAGKFKIDISMYGDGSKPADFAEAFSAGA